MKKKMKVSSGEGLWITRNFWYFFLVPGIGMLLGGFITGYRALSFRLSAQRTTGTVIANPYLSDSDSGSYHPQVEFETPDGHKHRFVSTTGDTPAAFQVGERVPVVYDEGAPERATIDTF